MIFLITRFQLEYSTKKEEIFNVISYISHTLGDYNWQNSISKHLPTKI